MNEKKNELVKEDEKVTKKQWEKPIVGDLTTTMTESNFGVGVDASGSQS